MPRTAATASSAVKPKPNEAKQAIESLILVLAERAQSRSTSDEYKLHESIARLYEAIKD